MKNKNYEYFYTESLHLNGSQFLYNFIVRIRRPFQNLQSRDDRW